jgi:glycosyltransferase involved in cell wall biosynthesis
MRISGLPKLNILRYYFWKIAFKNIYALTCPTNETKEYLIERNIIDRKKLFTLYDPIISTKEIALKKKETYEGQLDLKKTFVAIGRLTKQKNFLFLISNFIKFNKKEYYNLLIIGEGEDFKKLQKYIDKNKLTKNVKIINYQKNVYKYLINCKCFVMTSLWEDPGFVLVEASYSGIPIISTDCKSGPKEILNSGKNGLLFQSNSADSFLKTIELFDNLSADELLTLRINAKKKSKEFSIYNHFKNLNKILNLK